MTLQGSFRWNELYTRDPERAKAFYARTVGWSFDATPMADGGTYWIAKSGAEPVGGIFTMGSPDFDGVPEHWLAYITVDDVDARLSTAVAMGGSTLRTPFDIPGFGRIAILRDAGGAVIGLLAPAS